MKWTEFALTAISALLFLGMGAYFYMLSHEVDVVHFDWVGWMFMGAGALTLVVLVFAILFRPRRAKHVARMRGHE